MIFLTFNDAYSGIYQSQVVEVCSFFEKEFKKETKLVAFVSMRNFFSQRKLIKSAYPKARLLPMFPKVQNWKLNIFLLRMFCLMSGEKKIWARGPFACNLALGLKKGNRISKVLFDARGAYLAEFNEYHVAGDNNLKKDIAALEEKALKESDAQLAVSTKLPDWWHKQYAFTSKKCRVVPCTLNETFETPLPSSEKIKELRSALGITSTDIVLVYSGSSAGWQSFALLDELLFPLMSSNKNIKLIFLSHNTPNDSATFKKFGDRILTKWVKPHEVKNILLAADYGLLAREKSITNRVASPVKFAEYLSCGLQMIISEEIGDFTEFVEQHKCGAVYKQAIATPPIPYSQKESNHKLALSNFSKKSEAVRKAYSDLLAD